MNIDTYAAAIRPRLTNEVLSHLVGFECEIHIDDVIKVIFESETLAQSAANDKEALNYLDNLGVIFHKERVIISTRNKEIRSWPCGMMNLAADYDYLMIMNSQKIQQ